ncbi:MAG: ABC transporter substrate-binding protein [Bacillota bacterium]|nr:ABC transporter substrate-binding protein [Bacillota bacterium]
MKKQFKKLMALALCGCIAVTLSACGTNSTKNTTDGNNAATTKTSYKIGVIQFAPHPSLDNCYKGLVEGLKESGLTEGDNLTIDFQNAQGDVGNADLQAKNMVTSKYNLLVGIATPAAMSAYGAAKDNNIPVIFSAVSDPVKANIVNSLDAPGTNCTGTSDVLNLDAQLKMIRAFLPNAKKIGIIYTTSEPNSVSQLAKIQTLAPNYGFTIEALGVTNSSEVATAAASIVAKGVDCINNFTDNNVVNNLSTVLHEANAKKIPVFGSEVEQVKNGCLASESIDYVALGRETGKMAAKVLLGQANASSLAVQSISTSTPVYNSDVLASLGLTLPSDYASAEKVTTNK